MDHVAQCTDPVIIRRTCGDTWRLTGPNDYAQEVARCPLRYVLTDDLLRACIELAYSEGAGLAACLDLVHFPAEQMWIEWDGAVQRDELARVFPACSGVDTADSLRQGVLVSADSTGRTANLRTFWLTPTDPAEPAMAALETLVDLNGGLSPSPAESLIEGGAVGVRDSCNSQSDALLRCATFRLTAAWQSYYAAEAHTDAERDAVKRRSLATVAFDVPPLIALFLLMGLRSELVQVPVARERLNAKRLRLGRHPLLSHIEVSCPVLVSEPLRQMNGVSGAVRTAPRLHHVRGHIVRREDLVFWRRPHWRGHLRLGSIHSRTVTLGLPAVAAQSSGAT